MPLNLQALIASVWSQRASGSGKFPWHSAKISRSLASLAGDVDTSRRTVLIFFATLNKARQMSKLPSNPRAGQVGAESVSPPVANGQPQVGDLVVVRKSDATPPFGVLQHPTTVQFGASTRDAAVLLARSFAQAHKVDLWYFDENDHRLLERYRPSSPRK